jgi:hypothetical protein
LSITIVSGEEEVTANKVSEHTKLVSTSKRAYYDSALLNKGFSTAAAHNVREYEPPM